MIKHIWFDFSETIAFINQKAHNKLRYATYAAVVGKPVNAGLIEEFEALYQHHHKSNAAIFRSLGFSSNYWSEKINSVDPKELCYLADPHSIAVFKKLRERLPISLFSNIELHKVLPALGIESSWFTHILSSGMVKEPKPALDGFYKMIELSQLPPEEILYIGDNVGKDILPAQKVGIQAGIMWKYAPEADFSFNSFQEIFHVLK